MTSGLWGLQQGLGQCHGLGGNIRVYGFISEFRGDINTWGLEDTEVLGFSLGFRVTLAIRGDIKVLALTLQLGH